MSKHEVKVTVEIDDTNELLENVKDRHEGVRMFILKAISEYTANCSDDITGCGDADDDSVWIGATNPLVKVVE